MGASWVVLCWLLSASFAEAASAPRRRAIAARCDEHSTTLRTLIRHAKSFGGPLATKPQRALFGLTDVAARLQRGVRANMDDDNAAIQNDVPAARIDADGRATPTLQPLGLFVGPLDWRPRTRAFSPRSPRGPPVLD